MNIVKSAIFSSDKTVMHGFLSFENPMNLKDIANREGLTEIKTVNQIHSNKFVYFEDIHNFNVDYEADAIISDVRGYGVGVYTADCVPLIFADRKRRTCGVIHAGWKGTLSGIAGRVADFLTGELNCYKDDIEFAIGPCIEGMCYEIGEEIAAQFQANFDNTELYLTKIDKNKYDLDLTKANIYQLTSKGISSIETIKICTRCNTDYPSYRRDGKSAGRMLSFIGLV